MKICPKCSKEHEANGRYCSRACSNSRTHSPETKLKIQQSAIAYSRNNPSSRLNSGYYGSDKHKQQIAKTKAWWQELSASKSFDECGWETKRKRVIQEQNQCCNRCGLGEWLGSKLILEVDHKNGNNRDNSRENLEALCPNCHSLTESWRGRNKPVRNGMNNVSDEYLLQCLKETPNIRQALIKAGVAAKGGNYDRCKRLLGSN